MRRTWSGVIALAAACGVLLGGCATVRRPIKVSEIPKLYAGQTIVVSKRLLETPDGHLIEVEGHPDVIVSTTTQGELTFDGPVFARIEGATLYIDSASRPPWASRLADVQGAWLVEEDKKKNDRLGLEILISALALVLAAVFVLTDDSL